MLLVAVSTCRITIDQKQLLTITPSSSSSSWSWSSSFFIIIFHQQQSTLFVSITSKEIPISSNPRHECCRLPWHYHRPPPPWPLTVLWSKFPQCFAGRVPQQPTTKTPKVEIETTRNVKKKTHIWLTWVFPKKSGVFSQNGCFISWKNLLKWMIWGVKTNIFGNIHMSNLLQLESVDGLYAVLLAVLQSDETGTWMTVPTPSTSTSAKLSPKGLLVVTGTL